MKNDKIKSIRSFFITFVPLIILLCSIGVYLYIDVLEYGFFWKQVAFPISLEFILIIIGFAEIIRLRHVLKRPSSSEVRHNEEYSDEYHRQMQILCDLLANRVKTVLHDSYTIDHGKLLAQEQPFPNRNSLALPTVIAIRPKITRIGLFFTMIAPVALVFAWLSISGLILFFLSPSDAYASGDNPIVSGVAGAAALFFGLLLWFLYSHTRYWVKVTEDGLEARYHGRKMHIAWRDARYFSVSGITGSERLRTYTLLGEQGKVTWIELTESLVMSGFYQPVLPFNQYRWQCQALLEVVAGQTGLPLYDERLPTHRW